MTQEKDEAAMEEQHLRNILIGIKDTVEKALKDNDSQSLGEG